MKSFIGFFIKQSIALNIIYAAILLFGIFVAAEFVPVDQYPNFSMGKYTIRTPYPGASPKNVERLVTEPIEDSIRDMTGIEFVRSTSLNGMSEILVQMADDTNYAKLYDELRLRVLGAQNSLPVVNGKPLTPLFFINDVDEWSPVMQVNLLHTTSSEQLDKRSLVLLAKELRTRLEQVAGVKKVQVLGIEDQQFDIAVNPKKLEQFGITLQEITRALQQAGHSIPGGTVQTQNGELSVLLDDIANNKADIAELVIRNDGINSQVTLGQVMDWNQSGFHSIAGGFISNYNGQDATICKILKDSQANANTVKQLCIPVIDKFINAHTADHITYSINLDTTLIIASSIHVLTNSLFTACVLVVLTLFWFLTTASTRTMIIGSTIGVITCALVALSSNTPLVMSAVVIFSLYIFYYCRAAILTISGILFSFVGCLIAFYIYGYSINEVTLLGFVLTIGIIVDDAIIVLENIRRHREMGKPIVQASIDATAEVFWPVLSATLTTLAAFLPMLLMGGVIGQFFSLVPIAVSIALFISLVESLIFLPVHVVDFSHYLGDEPIQQTDDLNFTEHAGIIGIFHRYYEKALRWNIAHPWLCLSGVMCAFLIAIGMVVISMPSTAKQLDITPPLHIKFFPSDTSQLWIHLRMPKGSSLKQTDQCARDIAKTMLAHGKDVVDNVSCISGMTLDKSYNSVPGNQFSFIIVELASKNTRSFSDPNQIITAFRKEFASAFKDKGIQISVDAKQDGPPVGDPVNVRISGLNEESVKRLADDLLLWMKAESQTGGKCDGMIDLQHNSEIDQDYVHFNLNDSKLASFGITPLQAQQHLATIFDGAYVGNLRRSDVDVPIRLRIMPQTTEKVSDILNLPIINQQTTNGQRIVRFDDIGNIHIETTPISLVRTSYERSITITGNLKEGALYAPNFIKQWFTQHQKKYPDAHISFSGESESTGRSYATLGVSFGIAILLIYGILATQFSSYIQPLIIMSNIVFAFIGVIFIMSLFGLSSMLLGPNIIRPERSWFTIQCFMAVIGLAGLVVNDAIVLIDFINQQRNPETPLIESLITAGHQRMRPIIMTTLTTITGLLPMAIGFPAFSVRWSPFATAFIAGVSVSTAMTLLIIPVLYLITERLQQFINHRISSFRQWKQQTDRNDNVQLASAGPTPSQRPKPLTHTSEKKITRHDETDTRRNGRQARNETTTRRRRSESSTPTRRSTRRKP